MRCSMSSISFRPVQDPDSLLKNTDRMMYLVTYN